MPFMNYVSQPRPVKSDEYDKIYIHIIMYVCVESVDKKGNFQSNLIMRCVCVR